MSGVGFGMVTVVVEFVVEQDVDSVLVEALEEDELVAVVLVLLGVVDVDDVPVVVELLVVDFELVVDVIVEVELLVTDEWVDMDDVLAVDEEVVVVVVVVDDDLEEELEELGLGGVRTTYAATPATAITTITMAVIITGAIALLPSRSVSILGLSGTDFVRYLRMS